MLLRYERTVFLSEPILYVMYECTIYLLLHFNALINYAYMCIKFSKDGL